MSAQSRVWLGGQIGAFVVFVLLIVLMIWSQNRSHVQGVSNMELKLPYHETSAAHYREVKGIGILGPGVEMMVAKAREDAPFPKRLREIMKTRRETIDAFRKRFESEPKDREESIYVGAADDLLEAMFFAEIAQAQQSPPRERTKRLDAVCKVAHELALNPSWNTYTRKRILDAAQAPHRDNK